MFVFFAPSQVSHPWEELTWLGFALSHVLLRTVALIFAVWTTLALQNPCLEVPGDLPASGGDPPAL